jgi:predicted nucleic acid-binding protein
MRRGVDTAFLVQFEVKSHPGHSAARQKLQELLTQSDTLVIARQVVAEFVHVVTDPKRFSAPLDMPEALARAEAWWNAKQVDRVFPDDRTLVQFAAWMISRSLGRKRVLDTMLAATLYVHGVTSIVTPNDRDFSVFGVFDIVTP